MNDTPPSERAETDRITDLLHDALDSVPHSIHGREADWVDGSGEAIAVALVGAGWTPPGVERIEPGAEQAHRDDLARDVAREWRERRAVLTAGRPIPAVVQLAAALDRLSAAYGEQQ